MPLSGRRAPTGVQAVRRKFANQLWAETTARTAWKAGGLSVCGTCHAGDVARTSGMDFDRPPRQYQRHALKNTVAG